mmetsp:Transcript_17450/g.56032  ORF Transcript_17450/g.56032 Transcript_17450/m.56032 type:complete len:210 (+) Transcript_17450:390-1019(+)
MRWRTARNTSGSVAALARLSMDQRSTGHAVTPSATTMDVTHTVNTGSWSVSERTASVVRPCPSSSTMAAHTPTATAGTAWSRTTTGSTRRSTSIMCAWQPTTRAASAPNGRGTSIRRKSLRTRFASARPLPSAMAPSTAVHGNAMSAAWTTLSPSSGGLHSACVWLVPFSLPASRSASGPPTTRTGSARSSARSLCWAFSCLVSSSSLS